MAARRKTKTRKPVKNAAKKPLKKKSKAKKPAAKKAKARKAIKKAKPARQAVKRKAKRVRPPTFEQLVPSGEPLFVTPLEKL